MFEDRLILIKDSSLDKMILGTPHFNNSNGICYPFEELGGKSYNLLYKNLERIFSN